MYILLQTGHFQNDSCQLIQSENEKFTPFVNLNSKHTNRTLICILLLPQFFLLQILPQINRLAKQLYLAFGIWSVHIWVFTKWMKTIFCKSKTKKHVLTIIHFGCRKSTDRATKFTRISTICYASKLDPVELTNWYVNVNSLSASSTNENCMQVDLLLHVKIFELQVWKFINWVAEKISEICFQMDGFFGEMERIQT